MKRNRSRSNRRRWATPVPVAAGALVLLLWWMHPSLASAVPRVGEVPAGCVEHTSFAPNGIDYHGDYRCAGTALNYHTAGVAQSKVPLWAGQWLFVDEAGNFRMGTCTFNLGIHPTIDRPSTRAEQTFPMDRSGAKRAYLTWRYGRTTDNALATGMWAVMHFYAQDAAGGNRTSNPSSPLVPSLDVLGEMSGRQDLEDLAIALDAEAQRMSVPFTIALEIGTDGRGAVRVLSGAQPVVAVTVMLAVQGAAFANDVRVVDVTTDSDGSATFEIVDPTADVTVVATASAPAAAQTHLGAAVDPLGHLPQLLVTAGPAAVLRAEAAITIEPSTTEPATTEPATTEPATTEPATTELPTTSTELPTTSTEPTTTTAVATTSSDTPLIAAVTSTSDTPASTSTISATTAPEVLVAPPPAPSDVPPVQPLPKTGSTNSALYIGTLLLVAGYGVIGAVRRRSRAVTETDDGGFW